MVLRLPMTFWASILSWSLSIVSSWVANSPYKNPSGEPSVPFVVTAPQLAFDLRRHGPGARCGPRSLDHPIRSRR